MFVILVSCLLITLLFTGKKNIQPVKASPDIYQGDLILKGNNVTTIEGTFNINGSILVEENATLILRNAVLNFTQVRDYQFNMTFTNPTNGNPRLIAQNTTLATAYTFYINFDENTSCWADRLEIWPPYATGYWWYVYDSSFVSISNSRVYTVFAYGDSIFEAFNSTMTIMKAYSQVSANISLSYIESLNCFDSAVATASNSTINNLYTRDSSVARLVNSSYTSCSAYNESIVYVGWYLGVHVIDSDGTDVPSANVTATYPDTTVAESKLTDANGWTRLTLMEKMFNATGSYPLGNYSLAAKYEVYAGQESVNMTGNKEITISLPFIIPEFPSLTLLSLFMVATTLVIIGYRRQSKKGNASVSRRNF